MCCGANHDRLTTVGEIGIALRPVGGSGTVAACASCPIRNRKLDDATIVNRIDILDFLFLILFSVALLNYSDNSTLSFLGITDKLSDKVF